MELTIRDQRSCELTVVDSRVVARGRRASAVWVLDSLTTMKLSWITFSVGQE